MEAYKFKNAEHFGLFLIYCVEKDITVWRTYWDNRKKDRLYILNWQERRVYYTDFDDEKYEVIVPKFHFDGFGTIKMD